MFKRKNQNLNGNTLNSQREAAHLPCQPGQHLHTFYPQDYGTRPGMEEKLYREVDQALQPVLAATDQETDGDVCKAFLDGQVQLKHAALDVEQSAHQSAIAEIQNAQHARRQTLVRTIEARKCRRQQLEAQLSRLSTTPARYAWSGIPLLITLAFVGIDLMTQYTFLRSIYTESRTMLWLMAVLFAAFSDVPMYGAAKLLSTPEENVPKGLRTIGIGLFVVIFLGDSACSILIRIGSMAETFAVETTRSTVYQDSYSLAQWGATILSAIAPFTTGVICFLLTIDRNEAAAHTRKKLEKELSTVLLETELYQQELDLLEQAPDLEAYDQRDCALAHQYLEALHPTVELHVMKQLTARMNDPKYTDKMQEAESRVLARHERTDEEQLLLVPLRSQAESVEAANA
jgi:hypothetical protein